MSTGQISVARTFGALAAERSQNSTDARPKADSWLNVGYYAPRLNPTTGEEEQVFISIPLGIALDTQRPIEITSRNAGFAEMQAAQNQLLEDLQKSASSLNPGDERIVDLQIQLRRVNAPVQAPTISEASPLARRAPLFAVASDTTKAE